MREDGDYYSAVSLMMQSVPPAEIAERLGISRATVVRWNSEFKLYKEKGELDKLLNLTDLALHEAVERLDIEDVNSVIVEAKAKVNGLQLLDTTLQSTALNLANRINSFAMSAAGTDELVDLVDALCRLQTAFFNSNKVQVNVQNNLNSGDGRPYGSFMGDKPGA